jgi:hypothetical protein
MNPLLADLKQFLVNTFEFLKHNYSNPIAILERIIYQRPLTFLIPDRLYITIQFRALTGRSLNLKNPTSFNEKLQWLKLNDRKEWYTNIVDKVEVSKYVSERIGEQYIIPVIAVFNSVDEIDYTKLPDQFILKCTHDSGGTIICTDKSKLDVQKTNSYLRKKLNRNYFYLHREFPYKKIKSRIICEQFISPDGVSTPIDYKFFCFHGVPKIIQVDTNRFTNHGRLTLDTNWNKVPFVIDPQYVKENLQIEKPGNLDEMLAISKKLSQGFKFIRIDLYSVNTKIYFGEMTFYQLAGYENITPYEYNEWMGSLINLHDE